jgi:hypothetical protein
VSEGFNSQLAAVLRTTDGLVFVKGLRSDHPRVCTQQREALVNPHVVPVAPRLLWHVEAGGWNLLGFEHIVGRRADFTPGSADLVKVVDCLRQLEHVSCPDLPLKLAEQRWSLYCDTPEILRGDTLLHTDWNPANVLVNRRAHLVDWAWPTYGAGWIDPACWVVWLVTENHAPAEAERWAAHIPAWEQAPSEGLDIFATAQERMWRDIAQEDPDPWTCRIAEAAERWAAHRGA